MPAISAGNARVKYTVTGSGPALMLVHGVGKGGESALGHLVDQFAERNTVVLPDLSGSEAAEDDGGDLTTERLAEEVSAVIAHAGTGPVDLLGFSLGGAVVAATAALHPEQVRRLIPVGGLVQTDAYIPEPDQLGAEPGARPRGVRAGVDDNRVQPAVHQQPREPGGGRQARRGAQPVARKNPAAGASGPCRHSDSCRKGPGGDPGGCLQPGCRSPDRAPRQLHAAIANSSYIEVDSGHMVLFEKPIEFVKLVNEFIHKP